MALAQGLLCSDHSQVEVVSPCAPYLPDDCGICFLFVCCLSLTLSVDMQPRRYAAREGIM